jgi:hypothetical protein
MNLKESEYNIDETFLTKGISKLSSTHSISS